jgi:hypothetical protein
MKIAQATFAAALAAAVCGCSAPQKKAEVTAAPPMAASVAQMQAISDSLGSGPVGAIVLSPAALAAVLPVKGVSGMVVEPAVCARLASSDGKPVFDAQELSCIVGWMRSVQDYLYQGGTPTKYTNEAEFNIMKKTALDMMAAQTKWLNDAKFEAKADRAVASAAAVAPTGPQASSQSYLEGVIAYQKGDYIKARASWTDAIKQDPSNSDAQAGLEKLDKDGDR